jgi:hypothetical protein
LLFPVNPTVLKTSQYWVPFFLNHVYDAQLLVLKHRSQHCSGDTFGLLWMTLSRFLEHVFGVVALGVEHRGSTGAESDTTSTHTRKPRRSAIVSQGFAIR